MKPIHIVFIVTTWLMSLSISLAAGPYAGQQQRDIKALSSQEIDGLLNGSGMGMAKAAELNHYPGPKHVLELKGVLQLSEAQLQATQRLFAEMQAAAIERGKQIIELERELDQRFVRQEIDPQQLALLTQKIAKLRGELRHVHLSAHLKQRQVLTAQQLKHYDMLRGYADEAHHQHHH